MAPRKIVCAEEQCSPDLIHGILKILLDDIVMRPGVSHKKTKALTGMNAEKSATLCITW